MSPAHLTVSGVLSPLTPTVWLQRRDQAGHLPGGWTCEPGLLVFRVLPDPASVLLNTLESSIHNCDLPQSLPYRQAQEGRGVGDRPSHPALSPWYGGGNASPVTTPLM